MSFQFERWIGNRSAALGGVYLGGLVSVLGLAACAIDPHWGLVPGLIILVGLTVLQNLRRPIFVSQLNSRMDKFQRAAILSWESFARALTVASMLPMLGWAADHFGLIAVWGISAAIMLGGMVTLLPWINAREPKDP